MIIVADQHAEDELRGYGGVNENLRRHAQGFGLFPSLVRDTQASSAWADK